MEISQTSSSQLAAALSGVQQTQKADANAQVQTNTSPGGSVQISDEARGLLAAEQSGTIELQSSGSQAEKPR